jgi:hypothetical protein
MTAGERRVIAEASSGTLVDLSDLSDEGRTISPGAIRRLCVGPEAHDIDPRGIHIKHARLLEPLDLPFCTIPHPLRFETTTFDTSPDFSGAHLPALSIIDSKLPGLLAEGIRVDQDLQLGTSEVGGEVRLIGAKIGGQVDCARATLTNQGGDVLVANGVEFTSGVFLREGFSATGSVQLLGAKVGGALDGRGATLTNEDGFALQMRDARASLVRRRARAAR